MSSYIYNVNRFALSLLLIVSCGASVSSNALARPSLLNLNLYLGDMEAAETSGVLEGSNSSLAIGFGSSQRLRHHPYLALDMELWDLASDYRNTLQPPLFVSINDDMELYTQGITFGVRLTSPYDAPYHFYISGGFGYFNSNLTVFADLLGVPGYYEDSSREFAPYLGTGFTLNLGHRQTLEVFYRRWDIEGDFSRFDIPNVDIGGEAVGIGFGMYW